MTSTGDFGPAPAGMDLNSTQAPSMYGAIITIATAGTLAVLLRFYARISLGNDVGADDILIVFALIFTWGTAITSFIAIGDGLGGHIWVLTFHQFNQIWQSLFAYVNIYVIAVSFTKLSIVMFYKRVFALEKMAWVMMTIVLLYPITVIIIIFCSCQPLPYFWTQYTDPTATGECIEVSTFFFANGIWAACIDVFLIIVPIPLVWRLQMRARQKVAIVGVFMLAGFVVVASIVRIVMLKRNTVSTDPVWSMAPVYTWSCVEPFVGILCACLPTLSPLFKHYWGARKSSAAQSDRETPEGPGKFSLSLDTISGSKNRKGRSKRKLWPHDEVVLTTVANTHLDRSRDTASDEDVQVVNNVYVQKDYDVEWASQRTQNTEH